MRKPHSLSSCLRSLLVIPVVATGIATIVGSDECTSIGHSCTDASSCCSGQCENGVCCLPAGESVEGHTDADCCSGQSLDGLCCLAVGDSVEGYTTANCCSGESVVFGDQRFCCATDGMAAESPDQCCTGLTYVDGICWACPPGCTWTTTPSTVGEQKQCNCPGTNGTEVTVLDCPACVPCPGANPADIYVARVYSVERRQCMLFEVWAPNLDDVINCAKLIADLAASGDDASYVVENVTDRPEAQTCEGLW